MILVWSREFTHMKELSGDGRASEQLTLADVLGTHIVYNFYVTSFSLTMVTPTSHFFAFHWLCSSFPIGYLAKPASVARCICHQSPNSIMSTGQSDIPISSGQMQLSQHPPIHSTCGHGDISAITLLILSLARCSCLNIRQYTAPVGMMTFRWSLWSYQSICQQHPLYSHLQVTVIYYIYTHIY